MDKTQARRLAKRLERASKLLYETLDVARTSLKPNEFRAYRKSLSGVLGLLYLDLIKPLYDEWPDIDRFAEEAARSRRHRR